MEDKLINYKPRKFDNYTNKELSEKVKRQKELNEINRNIPVGSLVYYIKKHGIDWTVDFGTIDYHYPGVVTLDLYDLPDMREIDGVPIEEIEFPTRFQKLPKNWSYNTKLFNLTDRKFPPEIESECKKLSLKNPEDIKRAIELGFFVKRQDRRYFKVEKEIRKGDDWRLNYSYDFKSPCLTTTVSTWEIYQTYEEAEEVINQHTEELKFEASMSDEEWSIYQINRTLDRAIVSDKQREDYRNFLLSLDNIEEVEVRYCAGMIQWKYWKNKKWQTIQL